MSNSKMRAEGQICSTFLLHVIKFLLVVFVCQALAKSCVVKSGSRGEAWSSCWVIGEPELERFHQTPDHAPDREPKQQLGASLTGGSWGRRRSPPTQPPIVAVTRRRRQETESRRREKSGSTLINSMKTTMESRIQTRFDPRCPVGGFTHTCPYGSLLGVRMIYNNVECGECHRPAAHGINQCPFSECRDSSTGKSIKPHTKHVVCSRVCQFGGRNTRVSYLQRMNYDNTTVEVNSYFQKDRKYSTPLCNFRKVSKCRVSSPKCNWCSELDTECHKRECESCTVHKEVTCEAITPAGSNSNNRLFEGIITARHRAECNYAVNACVSVARYA